MPSNYRGEARELRQKKLYCTLPQAVIGKGFSNIILGCGRTMVELLGNFNTFVMQLSLSMDLPGCAPVPTSRGGMSDLRLGRPRV